MSVGRTRGRPKGQFNFKKESVFKLLKAQQAETGNILLHVSNEHIAEALGVSERQASRYITALQKEGRITTEIKRFRFALSQYSNIRIVTITESQ